MSAIDAGGNLRRIKQPLARGPARLSLVAATAALASACSAAPRGRPRRDAGAPPPPPIEVVSCIDLPRGDPRSHNLSGLIWDPSAHQLIAISDRDPWLVPLAPRPGFTGFDLGPAIALELPVEAWDGEAVTLAGDRLLVVANESVPVVFEVDRAGRGVARIDLPAYRGIRDNLGLEGIGYSASAAGRFLFVINEQALESDGPRSTAARGTVVRLLRRPLDGGADFEAAYLTEPIFADAPRSDNGVSDLAALSADRVLVLERAFVPGRGNAVRIFAVDLRGAQNIAALPDARAATPIHKRLVVDLAALPDDRCSVPPVTQPRKTLENYEGLALGPLRPDGRRLVFLVSDDNDRTTQTPRLLTLAIAPSLL